MPCGRCECQDEYEDVLTDVCVCGHARVEHEYEEDGPGSASHAFIEGTLAEWWVSRVQTDIERTAPKITEYGTKDLEAMGRLFAQIRGIEWSSDIAAVWGIMFYAQGKIARAIASLERGEMPSEDTLFDLSVYAMMARSYQARGKL